MKRTVGKHLSKVIIDQQQVWNQQLPLFLLAYRVSIHEITGQTPANVLFSRNLRHRATLTWFQVKRKNSGAGLRNKISRADEQDKQLRPIQHSQCSRKNEGTLRK